MPFDFDNKPEAAPGMSWPLKLFFILAGIGCWILIFNFPWTMLALYCGLGALALWRHPS